MRRALSPVVAAPLLVAITVLLAATVGVVATDALPSVDPAPPVVLSLDATDDGRLRLYHEGGRRLDVRDLRLRVTVDGVPLAHQPPVPFFAATGFRAGPTGPFNAAADPAWVPGESASIRLASTNDPPLAVGASVVVRVTYDGRPVARLDARVTRAREPGS